MADKNVLLEKQLKQSQDNCSSTLQTKEETHSSALKSLMKQNEKDLKYVHEGCLFNITSHMKHCNIMNSNTTSIFSKKIGEFSKVMGKKDRQIRKLQNERMKLNSKIHKCEISALRNSSRMLKLHVSEIDKYSARESAANEKLHSYIDSTHKLSKDIHDLKEKHNILTKNHTHVSKTLDTCKTEFSQQTINITNLNHTIDLYERFISTVEKKEEYCQRALQSCNAKTPVTEERLNTILTMHQHSRVEATLCTRENKALMKNISQCQKNVAYHRWETFNLTNNNNLINLRYELAHEANASCVKLNKKHLAKISDYENKTKLKLIEM